MLSGRRGPRVVVVLVLAVVLLGAPACAPLQELLGGAGADENATRTPDGTAEEAGEAAATPTAEEDVEAGDCTLNASYVADIMIPDDTEMAPGASFTKSWRIQNSGTCDWGPGFELVFVLGVQMGSVCSIPLPETVAGGTVDLAIDLQAPTAYGTHRGDWQMRSDEGRPFGSTFWVQIVVPSPEPPPATPAAATATPAATTLPLMTLAPPVMTVVPALFPSIVWDERRIQIAPGYSGSITAVCPEGSLVVGGGYLTHWSMVVHANLKTADGWKVSAMNHSTTDQVLIVRAACLTNVSGSVTTVARTVEVQPGGWASAVAWCPAGSIITGGGWGIDYDGSQHVYASSRASGNGWRVYANNTESSVNALTAHAICLSGTSGTTYEEKVWGSVGPHGSGNATCTCPTGLATGGGFVGQAGVTRFYSSQITTANTWSVWAFNLESTEKNVACYVTCVTF
jgi:hypothetical protein